jgi:GT2 family glycosyltransferase
MNQPLVGSPDLGGQIGRSVLKPPTPQRIAAIVVTHNRLAQLEHTIERLLTEPIDVVVLVDNGSTDGTVERFERINDSRFHLISLPTNRGGAGGFEEGLRQTKALFDPDWCVLMDDDARPEAGAVARFRAMDCSGLGGVAAAVYTSDGSICDMNRPSVNPFWHRKAFLRTLMGGGRMGFHLADDAYAAQMSTPIDAASFVGLFLSRSAIKATGFPDGRLFIYGDDVLYTLAMRRAGQGLLFAPTIRFEHDFKTFNAESRAFRPMWKIYYHYRNLLFVYRSAAGLLFWPALLVILPNWFLKARYYGEDWSLYLKFLNFALLDAMRGKLDRPHAEVLSWSPR